MKNGFNHRKIISATTMFIALLLLVSAYGCRTSKNLVQKSKENFRKEELKINKIDSISKVLKTNKITNFDSIGWSNYLKQYDISYNGTTLEDFGTIELTDKGWKFSGKVNVNLKENSNYGDFATIKNQTENINEQTNIKSNSEVKTKIEENKTKVDKAKENKSTGPTWNITIVLIVSDISIIYLAYRYFTRKG